MKKKLYEITIDMGVFDYQVNCVIGDFSKLEKYCKEKFQDANYELPMESKNSQPLGYCIYKVDYVPIIWLPNKPTTNKEHGTLAHESLHAMFHLFAWAGLPITRDTEEVLAHGISHIVKTVLRISEKI